jgi:hypothetical protein
MHPWQVFGLTGSTYLPDFPGLRPSVHFGFRTCSPLRGSSGFSPDSLFIHLGWNQGTGPLYLGKNRNAIPPVVNILEEQKSVRGLNPRSLGPAVRMAKSRKIRESADRPQRPGNTVYVK